MTVANAPFTVAPPRYQLPARLELGAVKLQVSNIEKSIAFYERVIGLRVLQRDNTSAKLGAHGSNATLVELTEKAGVRPVPKMGMLGLYHFAILLPTRAALGQLLAHLRVLGVHMGMSDHLVSEAIYVNDPDGLGIEVYADRPRESWKIDGTAIAMATDPIDVAGLLAAGGDTPWNGAPVGTRMGHVHLYVSNLDQAAEFFHKGIGFDKVTLQFRGALFMSAGGYHHHLGTNIWAAGSPTAGENDARLLEWNIHVPLTSDVADVAHSLQHSGIETTLENDSLVTSDPWGTKVRVSVQARH
ncbi:MAG: VOC family protein [Gemmatimonas sp.]